VEQIQCRVCRQELPEASPSELDIDARVRGLRRRIKDLESYTSELATARSDLEQQATAQREAFEEVSAALRRVEESVTLPKARQLAELAEARASLESRRRRILEHLELRRTARGENSNLLAVEERIERLRGEVHKREAHRPSPDALLGAFTEQFSSILRNIRFPDPRNPRIDRSTYLPFVREQPYSALSSSGAIALVVASWHLALLQVAIQEGTLHPRVLMLDSPLSHVGHDATDAQFKDQQIVEAFYAVLKRMHEASGSQFQLLVCDNRPPASARDLIQVEFTGDPEVGRFGLIDDETGGGR
jgi:DNA repair exonuclease SbcCD ATPase subunit